MSNVEFLAECQFIRYQRDYDQYWHHVIFKVRYEKWRSKEEKKQAHIIFQEINHVSQETIDYLAKYWSESKF